MSDVHVSALKTGMLLDSAVIHEVASALKAFYQSQNGPIPPLIVDPVCVSTSGHTLLQADAVQTLISELFPLATLIMPNKSEAELLLSRMKDVESVNIPQASVTGAIVVARKLSQATGDAKCNVLLKGGHLAVTVGELQKFIESGMSGKFNATVDWDTSSTPLGRNMEILSIPTKAEDQVVVDILYEAQSDLTTIFARPRIDTTSTHGTGCTLSAAITCYAARGYSSMLP